MYVYVYVYGFTIAEGPNGRIDGWMDGLGWAGLGYAHYLPTY